MKPSYDKRRTGHWLTVADSVRRSLGQFARRHAHIKVGATSHPRQRAKAHAAEWSRMEVVYSTSSYRSIVRAERELIAHGWANHWIKSWNEKPGGEGLDPHAGWYCLYILLD